MPDGIRTALRSEDGAVTVDWVVLAAAVVGLGVVVTLQVGSGLAGSAQGLSTSIATAAGATAAATTTATTTTSTSTGTNGGSSAAGGGGGHHGRDHRN